MGDSIVKSWPNVISYVDGDGVASGGMYWHTRLCQSFGDGTEVDIGSGGQTKGFSRSEILYYHFRWLTTS